MKLRQAVGWAALSADFAAAAQTSQPAPPPPGFSLENLPPSQVERIELTKGVTADRSTQAVAGTINIVRRATPKQRQRELSVRVGYTALMPTGGFNATLADRFDELSVSLPVSGYPWAGTSSNQSLRVTRDDAGALQTLAVDGEDRWSGGGLSLGPRLSWKPNDALTVESQTFAQRNEFPSDSAYRTQVLAGSTPVSVDHVNAFKGHWQMLRSGLRLTRKQDDGARLEVRAGVQATDHAGHNQMFGPDAQAVQTVERHSSFRYAEQSRTSSGKSTQPLGETHTLATGWDVEQKNRHEVKDAFENGLPQLLAFEGEPCRASVTRLAACLQDEWEIAPQWGSYLGARVESIATRSLSSTGVEFEIKGRAVDLLGDRAASSADVQVRASLSAYVSSVTGLPGPDNRLEQQQPWSLNLGLDDKRFGGLLGYGFSPAWTPGYTTQQTVAQTQWRNRSRNLHAYLALNLSRETTARLSVNNLRPPASVNNTLTTEDSGNVLRKRTVRENRAQWTASLAMKF